MHWVVAAITTQRGLPAVVSHPAVKPLRSDSHRYNRCPLLCSTTRLCITGSTRSPRLDVRTTGTLCDLLYAPRSGLSLRDGLAAALVAA